MASLANTAKYLGFEELINSTKSITAAILSGVGVRVAKATSKNNNIALGLLGHAKDIYDSIGGEMFSSIIDKNGATQWVPTFTAGFKPGLAMSKAYLNNWWSAGGDSLQRAARVAALGGVVGGTGYGTYMGYRGVRNLLGRDK
jgi:hypothetical protein